MVRVAAEKAIKPLQRSKFFAALAQTGIVVHACLHSGIAPRTAHKLRERDLDWAAEWEEALRDAKDHIKMEIRRRGEEGWEEPQVSNGIVVRDKDGKIFTIRKWDGRLLELRAKMEMPELFQNSVPAARPTDLLPDPAPTPDEPGPANPKI